LYIQRKYFYIIIITVFDAIDWNVLCCLSGSNVCSRAGDERNNSGRVQRGRDSSYAVVWLSLPGSLWINSSTGFGTI